MNTTTITIHTGTARSAVDITADASAFVAGGGDGLLNVFVPHATAGIAVIETGAGSDDDLLDSIERLLPSDDGLYRHRHGSPGHGADHVLPAWISPSVMVPIVNGELMLGTWQSIVLVDPNRDNPTRAVRFSFLS
ncbi:MAG: YjbQ family protein [Actinomycetia bacterium]|nr:YjbQ family protein [Actinomycetes bacterium]